MHEIQEVLEGEGLFEFRQDLNRFLATATRGQRQPAIDFFEDDDEMILRVELTPLSDEAVDFSAKFEHGLFTVTFPKTAPTTTKGDSH